MISSKYQLEPICYNRKIAHGKKNIVKSIMRVHTKINNIYLINKLITILYINRENTILIN